MADSLLSSDGSITAGALGGDSLAVPTVQEQARSAQIAAMKSDAAAVANTGDYLSSLVTQAASTHYGQVSLAHDTIAAAMQSKTATPTATVLAAGNKIGNAIVQSLKANLTATAQYVPAAGLSADYPPWERQLYAELPPADALRIAAYLRRESSLTDQDRAAIAQAATNPTAASPAMAAIPNAALAGSSTFSTGTVASGSDCLPTQYTSFALDDSGNPVVTCPPKVPPTSPPPSSPISPPAGPVYPQCSAYDPYCGPCWQNGKLQQQGALPKVNDNGSGLLPGDDTVLACRLLGGSEIVWNGQFWDCTGQGINWTCTGSPPVPPVPITTPPPPVACPPATGPICVQLPAGYAIVGPGQCAPAAGGGGPITLPPGSGGYTSPAGVNVTVPVTVDVPSPPAPPVTPPPPPPPPAPNVSASTFGYDNPATVCSQLAGGLTGGDLGGGSSDPGSGLSTSGGIITNLLQGANDVANWVSIFLETGQTDWGKGQGYLYSTATQAGSSTQFTPSADGHCTIEATSSGAAVMYGVQHWAERITGTPFTYFAQWMQYAYQYSCPQYLVGQDDFDTFYNAGLITDDQWQCYTQSLGNLPNLHRMARDLARTRPGFAALYMLCQRGDITQDQYQTAVTQLGIVNPDDQSRMEAAQRQNPGPAQLIDWMRLGCFAAPDGSQDGRGQGFDDAYTEDYKQLANAQGISDSYMSSLWTAQWNLPSLGDMIEMSHRYRGQDGSDFPAVETEDVKRVALAGGMAPAWVDRVIGLGDKLITRMQIQQAYNFDAIDRDTVTSKYQDVGYSAADAAILTTIADQRKLTYQQQLAAKDSPWTPKAVVAAYVDGSVNQQAATQLLSTLMVSEDDIGTLLQQAESRRDARQTSDCIKGYRRQFLIGAITDQDALFNLQNIDVDADVAQSLVQQWQCQMASRSRELGAEKNVQWFLKNILTIDDLTTRLTNLGFQPDDVTGYIQEALQTQLAQQLKAQQQADKAAAAARKAAQAAAKAEQAAKQKASAKVTGTKSRKRTTKETDGTTETDTTTIEQPPVYVPPTP